MCVCVYEPMFKMFYYVKRYKNLKGRLNINSFQIFKPEKPESR